MKLKDRVAFVTGGASGIGLAISHALAREGARVAVADIDAASARRAVAEIQAAGGNAVAQPLDVTDVTAVDSSIDGVAAHWKGLHVLVNCAGWDRPMPFVETTPEFWDRILAVNLRGPLACTRAALRHMIRAEYGKIVSIASDAGRVGSSGEAVYSACKGGIIALTKTLARELVGKGVTLNTLCPGPTDTAILRSFLEGAEGARIAEGLKRAIPMRRFGVPEDYPGLVAFLLSDDAAYITGQTISVSGGLTMHG